MRKIQLTIQGRMRIGEQVAQIVKPSHWHRFTSNLLEEMIADSLANGRGYQVWFTETETRSGNAVYIDVLPSDLVDTKPLNNRTQQDIISALCALGMGYMTIQTLRGHMDNMAMQAEETAEQYAQRIKLLYK